MLFNEMSCFSPLNSLLPNLHLVKKYPCTPLLLPPQDSLIIGSSFSRRPLANSLRVTWKCVCAGTLKAIYSYVGWDEYLVRLMLQQLKSK